MDGSQKHIIFFVGGIPPYLIIMWEEIMQKSAQINTLLVNFNNIVEEMVFLILTYLKMECGQKSPPHILQFIEVNFVFPNNPVPKSGPQKRVKKDMESTKLEFSQIDSRKRDRIILNLFTLITVKRINSTPVNSESSRATS